MKSAIKITATFLVMIALLSFCSLVLADSLWNNQSGSLYGNKPRSFQVGDLITIIIVEQAKATSEAKSSNGEKGSVSAGPGTGILGVIPQMGVNWDNNFDGKGTTTRGGSLNAKLTVQVKEVNPNGILVLEGRQVIKVNEENQVLTITGMARTEDVSIDNIVLSSNVANAVIEYKGKGIVGDGQKPGVLSQFFHWLL
jgi:flagellar L-ring protein FlgH